MSEPGKKLRLVYRFHCTNCGTNVEILQNYERRLCPLCGKEMNNDGARYSAPWPKKGGEK
jgi:predicted RNA-binding Zn-ribbon protein involved in translation (DUF1610 family)